MGLEINKVKYNSAWPLIRLKEACHRISDGTHFTPQYVKSGIPFISVKDIYHGIVHFEKCKYITVEAHKELIKRCHPEKDDILITKSGTIGRMALVPEKPEFSLFVSVALIKNKKEVIRSKFLRLCLENFLNTISISQDIKGGLLKNFHLEDIRETLVPVVDLNVQDEIVSKIEELFSEIENGIKSLFTAKEQLKKYRQSVLKWAFEGKLTKGLNCDLYDLPDEHDLSIAAEPETEYRVERNHNNQTNQTNHSSDKGELPEGWKWMKLNEIGTWKGGGTPSKSNKAFWENGNIFWVSPKDMKSKIIHDTIDKINQIAIENSSAKLIDKGSILFVVRSGILRRTLPVAITICNVTVNQDLQAFTPRDVLPDYVYWYVQSKNEDIRRGCSKDGTTVESIESSLLKNYLIPICSREEQALVIQAIESRLSVADKMEESIFESLQQAEALKQSILKKAFEGKLI
jgi:type I restriction enzyme S subunit